MGPHSSDAGCLLVASAAIPCKDTCRQQLIGIRHCALARTLSYLRLTVFCQGSSKLHGRVQHSKHNRVLHRFHWQRSASR